MRVILVSSLKDCKMISSRCLLMLGKSVLPSPESYIVIQVRSQRLPVSSIDLRLPFRTPLFCPQQKYKDYRSQLWQKWGPLSRAQRYCPWKALRRRVDFASLRPISVRYWCPGIRSTALYFGYLKPRGKFSDVHFWDLLLLSWLAF